MHRFKLSWLGIILMVNTAAWAAAPTRPAWLQGEPPQKWNRNSYITAVGSGKTLEDASASAKRGISEVFISQVVSQYNKNSSSNQTEDTSGNVNGSDESNSHAKLEVRTEMQLRNVEVVESYQDPESKEFFALAALNRLKAKNIYSQNANKLRLSVRAKLENFREDHRMADGRDILKLIDDFDNLNQEYSVLSEGHSLPPLLSNSEVEQIKKDLRVSSASKPLALEFSETAEEIKESLSSCLTEKGLKLAELKSGSAIRCKVTLKEKSSHSAVEGWVKNQFTLTANLSTSSGELGTVTSSKEGAGRSRQMSLDKVSSELTQQVCDKISKLIEQ